MRRLGLCSEPTAIDRGRVVAVVIFGALTVFNGHGLWRQLVVGGGGATILKLVVSSLTLVFYVLLIVAYLRRSRSATTDRRWGSWVVALSGTGAPFLIPLIASGSRDTGVVPAVVAVVLTCGLTFMLWSLLHLGTNVSVVPQARKLVTSGPYRWVRHPLYSAEILNVIGICLSVRGVWPWAVLLALVVLQVLRARNEEQLLSHTFLEYGAYRDRTPMLLPLGKRPRRAVAYPKVEG